ncbi:MAG: hypothetical protein APR54_03910 [Candidatus Cloacimonas sp. SDB]|nr:MAG: hypothetical protein APR54_03910 [Candidatus Cloacimonas sp. SDB]
MDLLSIIVSVACVIIGCFLGSILGFNNAKKIIKEQNYNDAKNEFKKSIIDLIIKIKHNEFKSQYKVWRNLADYSPKLDLAVDYFSTYLSKSKSKELFKLYNKYRNPGNLDSDIIYDKFEYYDNKYEEAILNLKKMVDCVD